MYLAYTIAGFEKDSSHANTSCINLKLQVLINYFIAIFDIEPLFQTLLKQRTRLVNQVFISFFCSF